MKNCVIYKIISPSNKIYIGQSTNVEKRIKQYKRLCCLTQKVLYNSLKKYGFDNHIFEIIEECDIELLNERERYWQEYHNSLAPNGLNSMLTETNSKRRIVSKETSLKLSESKKGDKNPMYNVKKSEEHKNKMSLLMKNRVFTEDWKLKISESKRGIKNSMYGKKMTSERKQLLKNALIEKFSGFNNTRSRIVLDLEMGIFYYNVKDASIYNNINQNTLRSMLLGNIKNKTKFIFT